MLQNGREKKEIIPNHVSFVYKALNGQTAGQSGNGEDL